MSGTTNNNNNNSSSNIQCHYDVLGVEQAADVSTIKKAHRKLALKFHPDKNGNDPSAAEQFRLVQQAYETLSDPSERKWYDDHRDAILNGWSASGGVGDSPDMLFDVIPFTYAGCFRGYGDEEGAFYAVYRSVFRKIYEGEESGTRSDGSNASSSLEYLSTDFGSSTSEWSDVATFYQGWESFSSGLNFAWADMYDIKEAPNRRVRRAMEDENKKARKTAKRARNDDVLALVRFVKKRDPRVQAKQEEMQAEKLRKSKQMEQEAEEKKRRAQQAREEWRLEAERNMAERDEEDRLAGRVRLVDLDDDYDYGGGKKKKGKGKRKKGKKNKSNYQEDEDGGDDDDDKDDDKDENAPGNDGTENGEGEGDGPYVDAKEEETETAEAEDMNQGEKMVQADDTNNDNLLEEDAADVSSEEESEPDVWRCECCRKDFKSQAQMENHMNSKKHKEAFKKYQKKLEQMEKEKILNEFLVS